jgi:hypothetical protein
LNGGADFADFSQRVGVGEVAYKKARPSDLLTKPKVQLRSYFPENWLFEIVELGENKNVVER